MFAYNRFRSIQNQHYSIHWLRSNLTVGVGGVCVSHLNADKCIVYGLMEQLFITRPSKNEGFNLQVVSFKTATPLEWWRNEH